MINKEANAVEQLYLNAPVSALSGVGPARAKQLQKLGIYTVFDIISHFPRAYEDRSKITPIFEMEVGVPACFKATVISYPRTSHIRKGMDITKLTVSDMTERLNIVFFNQPYVQEKLKYGEDYVFYGALREGYGNQIQNPDFGKSHWGIVPVYPLTSGITNNILQRCIKQALDACLDTLPDILPQSVREKYGLPDVKTAYKAIHEPNNFADLEQAKRRLVFEEFFIFAAGLAIMRSRRTAVSVCPWQNIDAAKFKSLLPFPLTNAQEKVIAQIKADISSGKLMNRLVQGDVGSGKTAVAAAAAFMAYQAKKQSALMAPTEILAEQHFATLSSLLSKLDMEVVLLTGSQAAAEKKWVKERIKSGQADLIIGTHALISDNTEFADLGLVITDEQHRFGVAQRTLLAEKGQHPHMLFLSATPIPRTLSLILYGDLDVSIINELPPGRTPIKTYLVDESMRQRIFAFVRKHVDAGNQVYVVCPAVEENEELNLKSAEVWADYLQKEIFPDLKVGLLHGKMKAPEKDAVMRRFALNEIHVLVATTVIEVGVDVPNATLILVEDADRFGLSQLHQLRGRVGRGGVQSHCVLMSESKKSETLTRLKALCSTTDGFKIAEHDLALRGPGDFFGKRQHGLPQFKVANLELDLLTLQQAQEATQILDVEQLQNDGAYRPLLQRIQSLFQEEKISFS